MTEKETQEKTSQEAPAEEKNTDNSQEEQSIPKASYDAVAEKYKKAKAEREELENKLKEIEQAQLKEKEDFKTLAEKLEAENKQLKTEGFRRDLIQEAITNKELHPKLAKMVSGSTQEEIQQSLEEAKEFYKDTLEEFKESKKAEDNSGVGKGKKETMSTEEWMELYKEDPEKANRILKQESGLL